MEWIQSMCPLLWQENCTDLQGKAARPMCNCPGAVARNRECRENPCLEGTQRHAWHPKPVHDRRLPSILDAVRCSAFVSSSHQRQMPKAIAQRVLWVMFQDHSQPSWAGISIKTLQLLSQERPLKARGAHMPNSNLALNQLVWRFTVCWFLLL